MRVGSRFTPSVVVFAVIFTILSTNAVRGDDWPQWRGPNRDGKWQEKGVISKFQSDQIPIKWRVKIGSGYSGPTVAEGKVYVTDRIREPKQIERVHCFDELTGRRLWKKEYDCPYKIGYEAGPRASVLAHKGRAYSLGAMGHLYAFDAESGKVLWSRDLNKEYKINMPIWGIAASPLVYGDTMILHIGGEKACIISLALEDGKERWRALSDRASYSAPILVKQGQTDIAFCWTGDSVSGINAKTGEVHWNIPFPPRNMPIGIATPIVEGNQVFLTSFYDGAMMVRLDPSKPAAEVAWKRVGRSERQTDGLQSIISTPVFQKGHIYGVDSYGELRCLKASDGARVWENLDATPKARWSTIHFVQNGDKHWMFNERGELIIATLSPDGYEEISRAKLIEPTKVQLSRRGGVCWAHPAYANRHVFARNDEELVCASLEAK